MARALRAETEHRASAVDWCGDTERGSGLPHPRKTSGLTAIRLVVGVLVVADVVAWFVADSPSDPIGRLHLPVLGVALLYTLAELAPIQLDVGNARHAVSMAELPFTLGLFLLVPREQLIAQAVGLTLVLLFFHRQGPLKVALNLAQSWAATAAGALVFHALLPADATALAPAAWALAAGAAVLTAVVSALAISLVAGLMNGRVGFASPGGSAMAAAIGALGNASIALLVVALLDTAATVLALLAVPLVVTFAAYHVFQRQRDANQSLSFLYRISQTLAGGREIDTSLAELADTIRQRLNVRTAVIAVAPTNEHRGTGIVARATDGEDPAVEHRHLSDSEDTTIEALFAGGAVRLDPGSTLEAQGLFAAMLRALGVGGDTILVPLRTADRALGFVLVGEHRSELDVLTDDHMELLASAAQQLSTSLTATRLENSLSELHRLQDTLQHRADHDELTGLCNRSRFTAEVDQELRHAPRSAAVLFLDLDDFKTINDSMGHHVGDELLRAVARRLEGAIKISDLVARLGGDEFAVLLRTVDSAHATAVAERLTAVLSRPYELEVGAVNIGISVGIAQHTPGESSTAATLLRDADAAMYAAKRDTESRPRTFEQAMHDQARERLELRNDLIRGVSDDEFCVHLQPLVNLADSRMTGAEALLRWEHPRRGLLTPEVFLDLAEESGVMRELGRRVLRAACEQAATWPDDTIVSVNVSRSQLMARDELVAEVASALEETGLAPQQLLLEVTEFAVTSDVEGATAVLRDLTELGVRIALDDFGTGHSSLSHLARLPVHVLKIAKPFVDALSSAEHDATALVAHGIIELAGTLGLTTIAEGIEHPEQADVLRRWGSQTGQGYLLGRPMSPTALREAAGWQAGAAIPATPTTVEA